MGFFSKIKKELKRAGNKVTAEVKRIPQNAIKHADKIGPALSLVPGIGTVAGGALSMVGKVASKVGQAKSMVDQVSNISASTPTYAPTALERKLGMPDPNYGRQSTANAFTPARPYPTGSGNEKMNIVREVFLHIPKAVLRLKGIK